MTSIKLCGINSIEAARSVANVRPDYAGFVCFPSSPRHVSPAQFAELASLLPQQTKVVLVTVNITDSELAEYLSAFTPAALQLHGHETAERCAELKQRTNLTLIKALGIADETDLSTIEQYTNVVDSFLLDAKPIEGELPGGNAKSFDWSLVANITAPCPWFLSGGLTADNVFDALTQTQAPSVDVSSGIEAAKGVKDPQKIATFVEQVREYDESTRSK